MSSHAKQGPIVFTLDRLIDLKKLLKNLNGVFNSGEDGDINVVLVVMETTALLYWNERL